MTRCASASGLDRPIIEQFFGYIGSALTGDLGVSFRNGDPVTATLLERLPATVSLGVVGHRHRAADRAARRHLVRAARGPRQRRDRPGHKPIRGLGPRLLDGHPADPVVRVDAGLAADVGIPAAVRRPRRLVAAHRPARR